MATLLPPKPFKSLPELAALLSARGMVVADPARAERKLGQVGDDRLSGFGFPCRAYADELGYHVAMADQDSRHMNPKQTRTHLDKPSAA